MSTPLRWNAMVVVLLLATALPAAAQKPTPQTANPAPPRVFLFDTRRNWQLSVPPMPKTRAGRRLFAPPWPLQIAP